MIDTLNEWLTGKFENKMQAFSNPSKYAILIVAPTMFSQQKSLIKKITHIWN